MITWYLLIPAVMLIVGLYGVHTAAKHGLERAYYAWVQQHTRRRTGPQRLFDQDRH